MGRMSHLFFLGFIILAEMTGLCLSFYPLLTLCVLGVTILAFLVVALCFPIFNHNEFITQNQKDFHF